MPDEAQKRTDPRIPLDRERLQAELQTNSRLITVHWNELRHKMDIDCFSNWQEESREHWHDDKFLAKLLSESLRPYYTGASVANIEMLLEIIAKSSPVIPPLSEIILPNKSDEREWGGELHCRPFPADAHRPDRHAFTDVDSQMVLARCFTTAKQTGCGIRG
jgi:hypothetical protein